MDKKVEKKSLATEAEKIWEEIKDKPLEMFALPAQSVSLHFKPVFIDPNKLFLQQGVGAAFPALELALGGKYEIDRDDRFIHVFRKKI